MIRLSNGARLVEVERNGVVESCHTGHVVVLGPDGDVRFQAGDPTQTVFARSSLKPLQGVGMLRAGVDLGSADVALAVSSHSGSVQHRELIGQLLESAGLTENDLDCPAALPLGQDEQHAYLRAGLPETRLAMNCSGKHTAMLLTCLANDWPLSGYLAPAHPLQQQLAATVSELSGDPIAATAVDGCGAPLFGISLIGLARAFRRIATEPGPTARVAEGMRAYPELVAGTGRSATRLMTSVSGLIAKDGAEGGFAAALPDGGAVAVKIDDGASRAADCAVAWSLRHLGVDPRLAAELSHSPVLGGGEPVGAIRPADGW